MSSEVNEYLENVIENIGGCGKFQFMLSFFVLGTKMVISWSVLMMSFGGVVPEWRCEWTSEGELLNVTETRKCSLGNSSISAVCSSKIFDSSMKTVVSEWDLVCDNDWIKSTITTIQMGGLFIGALISGQIGDLIGRRITYFLSVIIVFVGNLAAAFSVNWQMFATLRFFIGMGCGWYLTVFGTFIAELTPRRWRSVVLSAPTWAFGTMLLGLASWLIHDWKYLQIATAVFCLPWICGFVFIPESYRWLVSTKRIDNGYKVLKKVASTNGAPLPDKDKFHGVVKTLDDVETVSYSFLDIVKRRWLLKRLILLSWCWFSCGFGYYAISFGVEQLSGDLYLNMTLLGLMDVSSAVIGPIVNYFGRKWTTLFLFFFAGLTGIAVGVFEIIDFADKGRFINGFALTSKLCVATGWYALWILTSESYPTVVRNIGFGVNNSMARVGAMISPQLVFASKHLPGLSYIVLGTAFLISTVCVGFLEETNHTGLQDSIEITVDAPQAMKTVQNETNNIENITTSEKGSPRGTNSAQKTANYSENINNAEKGPQQGIKYRRNTTYNSEYVITTEQDFS